jgi:hypothetical protein
MMQDRPGLVVLMIELENALGQMATNAEPTKMWSPYRQPLGKFLNRYTPEVGAPLPPPSPSPDRSISCGCPFPIAGQSILWTRGPCHGGCWCMRLCCDAVEVLLLVANLDSVA